jgi:tetratricopeptide (TPR) repeat protein
MSDTTETAGLERGTGLHKLDVGTASGLSKDAFKPVAIDVDVKGTSVDLDYAREMTAMAEAMKSRGGGNGLEVRDLHIDTGIVEGGLISLTDTGQLLQQAEAAVQREEYGEALGFLDELLSLSPSLEEQHEARYLKALCHTHRADLKEALQDLIPLRGADLEPALATRVEALRARVRTAMTPLVVISFLVGSESDPEAARAELREVLELDPENAMYHYTLAGSFAAAGDFTEALDVVERALEGPVDERERLVELRDQMKRRLLEDVIGEALDAFKRDSYRKASQELRKVGREWREMPVVQDFERYLELLLSADASARELAPEGPFERVDALYFLLARAELDSAKAKLGQSDTAGAEEVIEQALKFVPRFPYLCFLYASCIYGSVGEWFSDPSDTNFDRQLDRLALASRAAAIATTDPDIGMARPLAEAIEGVYDFLGHMREALELRAREVQAVNAAIEEYQAVMKSAEGGIRNETHYNELRRRMRALRESMPTRDQVHGDEAKEVVKALGKAVKRNLDQLESMGSKVKGTGAAGACFETFERIMKSVEGGIETPAQVTQVTRKLRELKSDVAKARESVGDRKAKKALKRLANAVDNHLSQLEEANDAVVGGQLIKEFNALAPKLADARSLSTEERNRIGGELMMIQIRASGAKDSAKSREAKAKLAELEQAAQRAQNMLSQMW